MRPETPPHQHALRLSYARSRFDAGRVFLSEKPVSTFPGNALISERQTVLAEIRATDQDDALPVDRDPLAAAVGHRPDGDVMAARLQPVDGRGRNAALDQGSVVLEEQ